MFRGHAHTSQPALHYSMKAVLEAVPVMESTMKPAEDINSFTTKHKEQKPFLLQSVAAHRKEHSSTKMASLIQH